MWDIITRVHISAREDHPSYGDGQVRMELGAPASGSWRRGNGLSTGASGRNQSGQHLRGDPVRLLADPRSPAM